MNIFDYKKYILQNFIYENGKLIRMDRKNSNGSLDKDGYLIIKVKGKQFKAHRIVWLLNYGKFPDGEIDHINRNKLDNRIENLRIADRVLNNRNKDIIDKPNEKTGLPGIYIDKTKGLKKKYAFHFNRKTYRFYDKFEALKKKEELWNGRNKKCI